LSTGPPSIAWPALLLSTLWLTSLPTASLLPVPLSTLWPTSLFTASLLPVPLSTLWLTSLFTALGLLTTRPVPSERGTALVTGFFPVPDRRPAVRTLVHLYVISETK
jgi:hypothetical protein